MTLDRIEWCGVAHTLSRMTNRVRRSCGFKCLIFMIVFDVRCRVVRVAGKQQKMNR